MVEKKLPFAKKQILEIIKKHPTPVYIYDETAMVQNAAKLQGAFGKLNGFKEYFAVKALPNPFILKILKKQGFGADCSSMAELILAENMGFKGTEIMFTSNDTPAEEFVKAKQLGAIINLDDITHIDFLEKTCGLPDLICFRYNPGPARVGNEIIGNPSDAKFGLTREQIIQAYELCRNKGVKRFGLHAMVASNELNSSYFVETASMLFELAIEASKEAGVNIEFINIGGGIGIPYKPEQEAVSYEKIVDGISREYKRLVDSKKLSPLKIFMECGRAITGPYGYLLTKAIHSKSIYKNYVGLDACMANLMRPAMYGSYHHITVLGKENAKNLKKYDVAGSLCENNDKFAIDRMLPEIEEGDLIVIHDAGAHGHSMGFNYNGKLRSAELLLRADGTIVQIRRAETADDYFATIDWTKAKKF